MFSYSLRVAANFVENRPQSIERTRINIGFSLLSSIVLLERKSIFSPFKKNPCTKSLRFASLSLFNTFSSSQREREGGGGGGGGGEDEEEKTERDEDDKVDADKVVPDAVVDDGFRVRL